MWIFSIQRTNTNNKDEAAENNFIRAINIIKQIMEEVQARNLKCTRLGIRLENRTRTIKVIFLQRWYV